MVTQTEDPEPSTLRPLLDCCPEMREALKQATGCSFDPKAQIVTIHGGPHDGARFQPDAAGVFQRVES